MLKRLARAAADALAARDPAQALARAEALLAEGELRRAMKLLCIAAQAGLAAAQYRLALHYLAGGGLPSSPVQAGQWLQRAAEAGHLGAQIKLAVMHLAGLPAEMLAEAGLFGPCETRVDFANALHWAEVAAQAENAEASTLLAFILAAAPAPWRDEIRAELLYEDAAAQGYAQAQFALGLIRLRQDRTGIGRALIEQAAQAGLPQAHDALGVIYENAVGMVQDFGRSVAHYHIAAQAGVIRAMARYGVALLLGRGVVADRQAAETWLRRAALGGSAEAALRLGRIYAEQNELPPNYAEAAIWFNRAAEAGDAEAAQALGVFALNGFGAAPDPKEAASWFRRAAIAGNKIAAHNLAICHTHGIGVPRDPSAARLWLENAKGRMEGV